MDHIDQLDRALAILRQQTGGKLHLEQEAYFLFTNDAVFTVSLDDDDQSMRLGLQFVGEDMKIFRVDDWINPPA